MYIDRVISFLFPQSRRQCTQWIIISPKPFYISKRLPWHQSIASNKTNKHTLKIIAKETHQSQLHICLTWVTPLPASSTVHVQFLITAWHMGKFQVTDDMQHKILPLAESPSWCSSKQKLLHISLFCVCVCTCSVAERYPGAYKICQMYANGMRRARLLIHSTNLCDMCAQNRKQAAYLGSS